MNNSSTNTPPDLGTTVELIVYATQRRLMLDGSPDETARWQYHCPLLFGTEVGTDGVLSPVCYYDDKDISSMVIQTGSKNLNIVKPQGDPESIEDDYLFSITFKKGVNISDFCFQGVLQDRQGDWEWKGKFAGRRAQSRGKSPEEICGPDGNSTLQELLSYPSMSSKGIHIAQQEASHILGRILHASIPDDIKKTFDLNVPALDQEEETIRRLAPDFLPRAAVVNLFKQWHGSDHIACKQRDRIDLSLCDKFYPACAANIAPDKGSDPVKEFGWDRERDAAIIRKVQGQYRRINLACYRLGYRRKVTRLQPFLAHPAYWYRRLTEYLVSSVHCERFLMRVMARDPRVEPDIHDWYTQMALLRELAEERGDLAGTLEIEDVTNTLKGVALLSSINEVQLDESFITHLNELFTQIETLNVDSAEHIRLSKLLAMQQDAASGGMRRALMQFIQHYRSSCSRSPTVKETVMRLFRKGSTGLPDSEIPSIGSTGCLGLSPLASSMLTGAAMLVLFSNLANNEQELSLSEKITMCISLAPGSTMLRSVWGLANGIGAYMTEFLPSRLGTSLSTATIAAVNSAGGVWAKVGMTFTYALGVVVAGLCVWGAFDRFQKMWKDGENIDKWAAGCDLMFSVLFSIVTIYQSIAFMRGSSKNVLTFCEELGGGIAFTAVISSVAFAVVKWCWHKDPAESFITKYGNMYGLLKQGAR